MIEILLSPIFGLALTTADKKEVEEVKPKLPIKIERLKETHEQEVGSSAEITLAFSPTEKDFKACVPVESIAYPKTLPAEMFDQIFTKDEMVDLMKCSGSECAFNFTPFELKQFESLKTPQERQILFLKFYDDRVKGLMGVDPRKSLIFIRSKESEFKECGQAPAFTQLLNQRPMRDLNWRFSTAKYSKNMRPTTRLLQSASYEQDGAFCYSEALIFSDHYDVDRIEVWSLSRSMGWPRLKVQLRHRLDLLNSWVRRLSKEKFRTESDEIVETQLTTVFKCLETAAKKADQKSSTPAKN